MAPEQIHQLCEWLGIEKTESQGHEFDLNTGECEHCGIHRCEAWHVSSACGFKAYPPADERLAVRMMKAAHDRRRLKVYISRGAPPDKPPEPIWRAWWLNLDTEDDAGAADWRRDTFEEAVFAALLAAKEEIDGG